MLILYAVACVCAARCPGLPPFEHTAINLPAEGDIGAAERSQVQVGRPGRLCVYESDMPQFHQGKHGGLVDSAAPKLSQAWRCEITNLPRGCVWGN